MSWALNFNKKSNKTSSPSLPPLTITILELVSIWLNSIAHAGLRSGPNNRSTRGGANVKYKLPSHSHDTLPFSLIFEIGERSSVQLRLTSVLCINLMAVWALEIVFDVVLKSYPIPWPKTPTFSTFKFLYEALILLTTALKSSTNTSGRDLNKTWVSWTIR